jgi:hypothetical protein
MNRAQCIFNRAYSLKVMFFLKLHINFFFFIYTYVSQHIFSVYIPLSKFLHRFAAFKKILDDQI